jgi:hypothetical protein
LLVTGSGLTLGVEAGAIAPPAVFHSDLVPGVNAGSTIIAAAGPHTLTLWVETGPTASGGGEVCLDAIGDEICAFQLSLEATGDLTLTNFTPEASMALVWDRNATLLKLNRVNPLGGGDFGVLRLGTLELDNADTGAGGELIIASDSAAISAVLFAVSIAGSPVAFVPEPSPELQLGAGLCLLALLAAHHRTTNHPRAARAGWAPR